MRRLIWLGLAVLATACLPRPPVPLERVITVEQDVDASTLANGVRLVLVPDPGTSLVEVSARYTAGAAADPAGRTGLAHLVEHATFRFRTGDGADAPTIMQAMSDAALDFNAFTDWDSTHYTALAPAESLDELLALEARRLGRGCEAIAEADFAREREVVRNEIRQRQQNRVASILGAAMFPATHPYARTIGGDLGELASTRLIEVCQFLYDHYTPDNLILVIAGDVDPSAARRLAEATVGAVPRRPAARSREPAPFAPRAGLSRHRALVDGTTVFVGWPLPPRYAERFAAADVAMDLVRIELEELVREDLRIDSVDMALLGGKNAPVGLVGIEIRNARDSEVALAYLWQAIERVQYYVDEGAFESLRHRAGGMLMAQLDGLRSRAQAIADYVQFDARGNYFAGELRRYGGLDREDVRRAARTWLTDGRATTVVITPGGGRRDRSGARPAFNAEHRTPPWAERIDPRDAHRPLRAPTPAKLTGRGRHFTLANGLRVVLLPSSTAPVVTARLSLSAGRAHAPPGRPHVAWVAANQLRFVDTGTRIAGYSVGRAFHRVGGRLLAEVTDDETAFEARGLSAYADVIVAGLAHLVRDGGYEDEDITRFASRARTIAARPDLRRELHFEQGFWATLFGDRHPYANRGLGPLRRDDVEHFRERFYGAANASLVITGRFDPAAIERQVRRWFSRLPTGHPAQLVAAPPNPRERRVLAVLGGSNPTVTVRIGWAVAPGTRALAARLVAAEMIDGEVAAVRQEMAAAYTVDASHETRTGHGTITVDAQVDPVRAGPALSALLARIDRLSQPGDHFDRAFVRARRQVVLRLAADSTSSSALASQLSFIASHRRPPDYFADLAREVAALTPTQVSALFARALTRDRRVVGLLGARTAVLEALAEAGLSDAVLIE